MKDSKVNDYFEERDLNNEEEMQIIRRNKTPFGRMMIVSKEINRNINNKQDNKNIN